MINRCLLAFCICMLGLGLEACIKPETYPPEPLITDVIIDKSVIQQNEESFVISVSFQDGDGNIGADGTNDNSNAFLTDSRTGFVDSLTIPDLAAPGDVKSISGTIDFTVSSECCIALSGISCTPNAEYNPTDTVIYQIVIQDRALNVSNVMETPPLIIVCPQ